MLVIGLAQIQAPYERRRVNFVIQPIFVIIEVEAVISEVMFEYEFVLLVEHLEVLQFQVQV